MREIKFRAWDIEAKRMSLPFSIGCKNVYFSNGRLESPSDYVAVSPDLFAVGQFTGLLDKNGTEIFEGDIYHPPYGTGVIKYHKCAFVVTDPAGNMTSINGLYNTVDCAPDAIRAVTCEVIGNIHESPELLKETA